MTTRFPAFDVLPSQDDLDRAQSANAKPGDGWGKPKLSKSNKFHQTRSPEIIFDWRKLDAAQRRQRT